MTITNVCSLVSAVDKSMQMHLIPHYNINVIPGHCECYFVSMVFLMFASQTGKNTCYAEYVRRSSMIAQIILGCVRRNMACAQVGASGSLNSPHTRESCVRKKMTKEAKKGQEKL